MVAAVQQYKLPFTRIPEILFKAIKHSDVAGLNFAAVPPILINLIAAPSVTAGILARGKVDSQLREGEDPNPVLQFLSEHYPKVYIVMIVGALLAAIAACSPARTISYLLGLASAFYLARGEGKKNEALKIIHDLKKELHNPQTTNRRKKEIEAQLEKELKTLGNGYASMAFFSRCLYCLFMGLTFWRNSAETSELLKKDPNSKEYVKAKDPKTGEFIIDKTTGEYKYEKRFKFFISEERNPTRFFKDFFSAKVWGMDSESNLGKELRAGLRYINPFHQKAGFFWKGLTGKDEKYEQELNDKGIKEGFWPRLFPRLANSHVACRLTMANMALRVFTVLGTIATVFALGGINVFNNGDKELEDPECVKKAKDNPLTNWFFKAFLNLNNFGMLLMGLSSVTTGMNPAYKEGSGPLASAFQLLTGAFYTGAAGLDQVEAFTPAQGTKIIANGFANFANIFATANKSVDKLVKAERIFGLPENNIVPLERQRTGLTSLV